MKIVARLILLLYFLSYARVFSQEIKIDHVVLAYPDIEKSKAYYSDLGFTVTEGRRHQNNLINAHIKFSNLSYIELISVSGAPNDDLANRYTKLIDDGNTGAFLALSGISITKLEPILKKRSLKFELTRSQLWNYLSFYEDSDLAHIFFIEYKFDPKPQDSLIHPNSSSRIDQVFIEGNPSVINLFQDLGLDIMAYKKREDHNDFLGFETSTGGIIIELKSNVLARPKVNEIRFSNQYGEESFTLKLR